MSLSNNAREAKLQQLIDDAPKTLTPERDLWQDIEKRMDKPLASQPASRQAPRLQGAQWAIAATIVLAVFFGFYTQAPVKTSLPEQIASQAADDEQVLQALLSQIAQTHQAQVTSLAQTPTVVAWQTSRFSAPLEQGLAELRRAGEQIYQALQANPTDKQLWQLWLWVQQRELDLLQQGQKLPIQNSTQGNSI
ncbi:anti-sigma factor [Shewanella xiamenensis]|uniref:anti-sigma factor n=1 Tax=Shewanella xiamenensis TaxID=332186 RepID=UPI001186EAF4|nr:anti-sigma factor [Shewanella xiamenensis]TVL17397.1 anti-sigma factor [Shewanella xiamenensis]TVL17681.1 anti-sigma factor [Shewanella xiamenensis]TVL25172.1 anti-sigma factor [Shewanella xiamenensis]TVL31116.1 anti-sigma factor [Shewanella xiamenensis]TVP00507.1 anti-sigma factor [Shewanella xiamenensis]